MRATKTLYTTQKETPGDAEVVSHRLMLRAGMIRPVASGLYTWMPLGMRVLNKVRDIIREEMDAAGALETFMPAVQPAELWEESGRWDQFGPELLRLKDRHERDFCLGPTHEEVITDLARRDVRSYRQLPINMYQVQTKFRDEVRPRFGVMRSREFIMKDAYSFDIDAESLGRSYENMRAAYVRIFDRFGMDYRMVDADSGAIGGAASQEFHVLADSGEDDIAFCSSGDYASNIELVPCPPAGAGRPPASAAMAEVATPGVHTMDELAASLKVPLEQTVKTLLVEGEPGAEGEDGGLVALVLRGDRSLNAIKAAEADGVASPVTFASAERVKAVTGCEPGSLGPQGLDIPVLVDHEAAALADFVAGANRDGFHTTGLNWGRDLPEPVAADLRNAVEGDPTPGGGGTLKVRRGIEVGHIFQLGLKYSQAMNAVVLDPNGKAQPLHMGCYGIGVTRVVAAAIEQNHDKGGIIWPTAIAPYTVALLPMNMHKSQRLREAAEALYAELTAAGIEVLMDDRNVRPGVMFADQELIGIPYRVLMGERGLDKGIVEFKHRRDKEAEEVPLSDLTARLKAL